VKSLVRVACYASDKDWNCYVEYNTVGKSIVKVHVEGKETYVTSQEQEVFIADARAVYVRRSKVDSDRMIVEVWL
jgi:purine nucleoside permease